MITKTFPCSARRNLIRAAAAAFSVLTAAQAGLAQTWTRTVRNPPAAVNLMLLLSDGTVMAANNNGSTFGSVWYRLTPDIHGSYVNGTWTTLASMHATRLYYSSVVLRDGRVFVAGGEYGTGGARAEIYDPVANTWTELTIPTTILNPAANSPVTGGLQKFSDSNCEILANGNVMIMPVAPLASGVPVIYNPVTNAWSAGPRLFRGVYQDEASWVKLPDNSILTIDPFGTNSERYIPSTNTWVNDGVVPVSLYDSFGSELGAAFMLPNGKAFYLGATGHTALYTPSGTTSPGTWAAGPDIPGVQGTPDAPAAMLVTGNVLCAVSPVPTMATHFPSPTSFYEYDPFANSFTAVSAPTGATDNRPTYQEAMLDLPDGTVLYSHFSTGVYVYQPSGAPLAAGKPTITGITPNGDGSYHLTGLGLNGISEGANYGDDLQMNSNYPLVRLSSGANVYYARTYNWSSTGVMTGSLVVTTEFRPPASLPSGSYSLVAVANGIASDPVLFCTTPLSITTDPLTQTVCAGSPVSLTVIAAGSPTLTYQWRKDSVDIAGATSSTLTIASADASDAAAYECIVSNPCGSITSASATLTIGTPPILGAGPTAQTVCGGLTFSFSASATGSPSYQWRKDGINIPGATADTYSSTASGAMAGTYDCVVSNTCGSATTIPATLTVCVADTDDGSGSGVCDGGVGIEDLLFFLGSYNAGTTRADVDDGSNSGTPDGGVGIEDLLYYLNRYNAGC